MPTSQVTPAGDANAPRGAKRVIKKYPNRRLYDTDTSSYITLAEVKALVMKAEPFSVRDAKTGEDLTRSILLQIILEEEAGGAPMFSEAALANLIRFYGHTMQGFMGSYLEKNVQAFIDMQAQFGEQAQHMNPLKWTQGMNGYFEQSQALFAKMQEQMLANLRKF